MHDRKIDQKEKNVQIIIDKISGIAKPISMPGERKIPHVL